MNRQPLPPLPSLEDLFSSPCPFISPVKSEPLLTVVETVAPSSSNHFEPISDEEADEHSNIVEPASKRWKSDDLSDEYFARSDVKSEGTSVASHTGDEGHAKTAHDSYVEESSSGERNYSKSKRSHRHSREDRKSGEHGRHRRRSSRAEKGSAAKGAGYSGAIDVFSEYLADNAYKMSDHASFPTDTVSAGIYDAYGTADDTSSQQYQLPADIDPFSASYGYDSYTNVVEQGFPAPDDDFLPLIPGGVTQNFIDPDEFLSSSAPIGPENDRVNSSGDFSGISDDFLAAAAIQLAGDMAAVEVNVDVCPRNALVCPMANIATVAMENCVVNTEKVFDGMDSNEDEYDEDAEGSQVNARVSTPSDGSAPVIGFNFNFRIINCIIYYP